MSGVQSIRVKVKKRIYIPHVLHMEVSIQRTISLTHADENSTPREIEQEAAELDNFLRILTEVF